MSDDDKDYLIVKDNPEHFAIRRYPVATIAGQEILRGTEVLGVIREATLFHSENGLLAYLEAQRPRPGESKPKPKPEPPDHKADIMINISSDGEVYMGFFAENGAMAILNMESVAKERLAYGDGRNGLALLRWVRERQRAAAKTA